MTDKTLPERKYHDGDIVEFDFEPNSLDVYWHKVTIIGVISGVLYEKDGILYKVQLRDNERRIFGDIVIPEENISWKIKNSVITTKCDFCERRIYVDRKDPKDIEMKTKGWDRLYCFGKKRHILNICDRCIEMFGNIYDRDLKCPHDGCNTVSKRQRKHEQCEDL